MAHGHTRRLSHDVIGLAEWFSRATRASDGVLFVAIALLTAMRAASRTSLCTFFHRTLAVPYGDAGMQFAACGANGDAIRARDEAFFMAAPLPPTMTGGMPAGLSTAVNGAWRSIPESERAEAWARLEALVADADAWWREREKSRDS